MQQSDLLRYSCQIALPGFGEVSQERLQQARVLVVGAGGLGCPAAQYLAAAGIGTLRYSRFRHGIAGQFAPAGAFHTGRGRPEQSPVACQKLQQQNTGIRLVAHELKVTAANVLELLQDYDVVLDGTDNFDTKYLLNDACVLAGKPLVYGAIYQFEGQVAVWNAAGEEGKRSPNYRDVFPEVDAAQVPNCAEGGVIPTLAGMIGCMQANEVLKLLTGAGEPLVGKLLLLDALTMQSRIIKVGKVSKVSIEKLPETEEVPLISVQELKQGIAEGLYELVDVRSGEERMAFHIGGQHVPLDRLGEEAGQLGELLPSDKPLVFYCASGKRSGEAVKRIRREHPDLEVYSLEGGMKAWKEQQ
jgi:sulfur-carrier protein adenylyltransferase/sulfurtransferase